MRRFADLDKDKNGKLDIEEVVAGASILHLSEEEARSWFNIIDRDKSGDISCQEFLNKFKALTDGLHHFELLATEAAFSQPRFKSEAEILRGVTQNSREAAALELTNAKDQWQRRQAKSKRSFTIPQQSNQAHSLHYMQATNASIHHSDAMHDPDHQIKGEATAFMLNHERKLMSDELSNAKESWFRRQISKGRNTIPTPWKGKAGQKTEGSRRHHDGTTVGAEISSFRSSHSVQLRSQEAAKEKERWAKRSGRSKSRESKGRGSLERTTIDMSDVIEARSRSNLWEGSSGHPKYSAQFALPYEPGSPSVLKSQEDNEVIWQATIEKRKRYDYVKAEAVAMAAKSFEKTGASGGLYTTPKLSALSRYREQQARKATKGGVGISEGSIPKGPGKGLWTDWVPTLGPPKLTRQPSPLSEELKAEQDDHFESEDAGLVSEIASVKLDLDWGDADMREVNALEAEAVAAQVAAAAAATAAREAGAKARAALAAARAKAFAAQQPPNSASSSRKQEGAVEMISDRREAASERDGFTQSEPRHCPLGVRTRGTAASPRPAPLFDKISSASNAPRSPGLEPSATAPVSSSMPRRVNQEVAEMKARVTAIRAQRLSRQYNPNHMSTGLHSRLGSADIASYGTSI
jgi:hypothetical protein